MRSEEKGVAPQKYLNLYKYSQAKIEEEKIISESLLQSLIRELRTKEVEFLADTVISSFYNSETRKSFKKIFLSKMNEIFFDDIEWKLEQITSVGYSSYGYEIYFKLNKQKYGLFVPYPKNLNVNNISSASYGRYDLMIEAKPSVYHSIILSYDAEDIKAAIKKESEVNSNG